MNARGAGDTPRNGEAKTPTVAVTLLVVCVLLILELPVHAHVRQTAFPWGLLTVPLAALTMLIGVALSLYLLLNLSRRWSVWARVGGLAALCLLFTGAATFFSVLPEVPYEMRPSEVKAYCLSHVKSLSLALCAYAVEEGGFPTADGWQLAAEQHLRIKSQLPELLTCPAVPDRTLAFAYNAALAGVMYSALDDPARTVLLFESDARPGTLAGGRGLLPAEPRHFGGDNYGFADGHAEWLRRKQNSDGTYAKEPAVDWVRWEVEGAPPTLNDRCRTKRVRRAEELRGGRERASAWTWDTPAGGRQRAARV
ncbi:MAG: hypothetical protein JXA57_13560 [Armatimonadetes bacterium]|nr:hypothetical protein [Armatimonadota bacterium]